MENGETGRAGEILVAPVMDAKLKSDLKKSVSINACPIRGEYPITITFSTLGQHRIAASATYSFALCESKSPAVSTTGN